MLEIFSKLLHHDQSPDVRHVKTFIVNYHDTSLLLEALRNSRIQKTGVFGIYSR